MSDTAHAHKSSRTRWIVVSTAAIAILLLATLVIVKPAMPDRITLLAGPAGSADHALAQRYAEDLQRRGLDADVVVTEGALDTMRRLAESANAVGFLPAAIPADGASGIDTARLVALGSIGFSPLWLFHRSDLEITRIQDLAGRRVATGGEDTASDHVVRELIEMNGLNGKVELRPTAEQTAHALVESFKAATLDAAFVTGSANSNLVRALLDDEDSRFVSFDRADAYAALIPGVTALTAPEGVFDLARNVPPRDARLLATTICLVAREGLHRAVAPMLLVTAENLREKTTTFSTAITFPSPGHVAFPLDRGARRYFDQGETALSRFLPYKAERYVKHLTFVVLPLLAVVFLLLKFVPAGLRVWSGLKLKSMFKQLESVEKGHAANHDRARLLGDLDRLDRASATMFVPRSTVQEYIDFRQFLHDMRERVCADAES
jgi:TRAP-type uncharacterized transport system substrate-binding protein